MIEDGTCRFESLEQLPGWDSILGMQFENLVLGALPVLVARLHLGISRILSISPYRKFPNDHVRGCQIDCLIQTSRSTYLIEIKRRKEIGRDVIGEIEEKVSCMRFWRCGGCCRCCRNRRQCGGITIAARPESNTIA